MSRVCAVVLNWNGADHTLACLASLLAGSRRPELIVVCDNASGDDSVARIEAFARERLGPDGVCILPGPHPAPRVPLPALVVIANPANLGYAGGNNPGIRLALGSAGFDFVWILNNDVCVQPEALARLLGCAQARPEAGVFGATILKAGTTRLECAGGCRYNPLTTILAPALAGMPLDQALQTPAQPRLDYISGAAMLVRSAVFRQVGLLNEDYFLYNEELDLCRRATAAGFDLAWCREAVVSHAGGASLAAAGGPGASPLATYHETRSTLLFTRRFHPRLLPYAAAFRLLAKLTVLALRGRLALMRPVLAAYRDVFLGK
jgi:GT2 family glycosyltransferase